MPGHSGPHPSGLKQPRPDLRFETDPGDIKWPDNSIEALRLPVAVSGHSAVPCATTPAPSVQPTASPSLEAPASCCPGGHPLPPSLLVFESLKLLEPTPTPGQLFYLHDSPALPPYQPNTKVRLVRCRPAQFPVELTVTAEDKVGSPSGLTSSTIESMVKVCDFAVKAEFKMAKTRDRSIVGRH